MVICAIAGKSTHAIKFGKPSIFMGHFPWLLLNNQMVGIYTSQFIGD
jgi:hypothetical protein